MKNCNLTLAGLLVAIGLAILGLFINMGIGQYQDSNRTMAVRGLAEREVEADKVLWPVCYTQTGSDLQQIYAQIEKNNDIIVKFLVDEGLNRDDIIVNAASIVDLNADRYNVNTKNFRYIATQVITVNSKQVSKVVELRRRQIELVKFGIAISNDSYQYTPKFEFTGLNDIKPDMIADATKAARESADKFAHDNDIEIGDIRSASQGQFSISDRDEYTPQIKHVRVVTYVTYQLD